MQYNMIVQMCISHIYRIYTVYVKHDYVTTRGRNLGKLFYTKASSYPASAFNIPVYSAPALFRAFSGI